MTVKEFMTEDPVACILTTDLGEVAQMMVEYDCGEIPVVDTSMRPIGVITDRDIICRAVAEGKNPLELTAADCMTSPCVTVTPQTDLVECCRLLQEYRLRRVVVVDEDSRLCGIVAQADIAQNAPAFETARVVKDVSQAT